MNQTQESQLENTNRVNKNLVETVGIKFINSLMNISQIAIAVYFFFNGIYQSYFILFCILYGIKEISSCVFIITQEYRSPKKAVSLILLDIFLLGFLSPFFGSSEQTKFYVTKNSMMILYQAIIIVQDFIYFFVLDIIDDDDDETIVNSSLKVLCYLSFAFRVMYIGIIGINLILVYTDRKFNKSTSTLNQLRISLEYGICLTSFILGLAQLWTLRDNFSINLAYYILAMSLSFFIFKAIQYGVKIKYLKFVFLMVIPVQLEHAIGAPITNQQIAIFQYLCSLITFGFILGYTPLNKDQPMVTLRFCFSITFVSLYLLLNARNFFILISKNHRIKIYKKSQIQSKLQKLILKTQSNKQSSAFIEIHIRSNDLVCADRSQPNNDCAFYQLQKYVSLLKKNVKKLSIYTLDDFESINYIQCECSRKKILSEQETIFSNIKKFDINMDTIEIQKLLLERSMRGILFTSLSVQIKNKDENVNINELIQNIFSVTAYDKHIKDIMIYNPAIVLYDLYV